MTAQFAKQLSPAPARDRITVSACPFPATPVEHTSFFTAGSEIYAQGEKAGTLYQVEFGCVRLHSPLADGRRQIAAFTCQARSSASRPMERTSSSTTRSAAPASA